MLPKFDALNDPPELLCPVCGFNYLHHFKIEIFDRAEDATSGLHVTVEKSAVTVDSNLQGNPSGRRDGLSVRFWCEGCHNISMLTIGQHKGNTEVSFHPTGEKVKHSPPPQ